MKRVSYVFPTSHHFRLRFHELLRQRLAAHEVDYVVVYSDPPAENRLKRDTVEIDWGRKVSILRKPHSKLAFQFAVAEVLRSDLVIIQQENALLLNYVCLFLSLFGLKRVAYFGHGRNFQARDRNSLAERWKRFWTTKVDWWFAYTDETRRVVESLGFPRDRITVFNNAVDTSDLRTGASQVSDADAARRLRGLGLSGRNTAIFVGGLYPDKRIDFLVEAADRVRAEIPDFELVVTGGGPDLEKAAGYAATRPWLVVTGPQFGRDKLELMRGAKLFLMPGLVGLAVLDAAALGLPVVTTAYPYHSPEIAYLEDGVTGCIVPDWESPAAYADAVVSLLRAPERIAAMAEAARWVSDKYTIEAMADRFAGGVLKALEA